MFFITTKVRCMLSFYTQQQKVETRKLCRNAYEPLTKSPFYSGKWFVLNERKMFEECSRCYRCSISLDILAGGGGNVNQTCFAGLGSAGNVSNTSVLLGKVVRLVGRNKIWNKSARINEGQRCSILTIKLGECTLKKALFYKKAPLLFPDLSRIRAEGAKILDFQVVMP